jgi:hypothetical protein
MCFTKYRSKALTELWAKGFNEDVICRHVDFDTRIVDDICANNWKANNPVNVCTTMLYEYIRDEIL